ncbi:hypothetical protein INR49_031128 [Caranx melampygus]|nr:hypothetical protein INR49_031128 [Caranx melampygus]
MGGGDLNLKKSWHPQTMKNIERVWKAEQKYEAERKKIEELQKELKEERAREEMTRYAEDTGAIKKKDDRLDWMYQGPAGQVSRDEYLLGRPIDKQITDQYEEPESGPSAETGLLPGSIFNPTTPASNLDLAAKIREDPLFEISSHSRDYPSADNKSRSHHVPGYGLLNQMMSDVRKCQKNSSSVLLILCRKLSAEDLERKRREMMDEAKQREEDRENNVKRYKRQDEQERQREQNAKHDRHAGFIHNMKLESAASSSLEDRVKRNIHSIQRTAASMDNFMKR